MSARTSVARVIDTVPIEGPRGFSGTLAVLDSGSDAAPREGVLVGARLGAGARRAWIAQTRGVWELALPTSTGRIVLRPQLRSATLEGKRARLVAFGDRSGVRAIDSELRRDDAYRSRSLAFFRAAVSALVDAESAHDVHVSLLDAILESREAFREQRGSLRGGKKPGKAGWGGVEVGCFAACMADCEADAEWYEVWKHAYCLAKCALECGTGGGPIFPD